MSLDQNTANQRAAIIRQNSISYNYNIILQSDKYYGLAEIVFYIDNLNFTILPIDFTGHEIQQIVANSAKMLPQTTTNFVNIPKNYLQKGRNKITIMYTNLYDKDRIGCISFFDKNKKQYVFTDFEPYGAHRVFPCFDQPNLKARMKLSVVAPTDWSTVVSNQPAISTQKYDFGSFRQNVKLSHAATESLLDVFLSRAANDTQMTFFPETELISTYIFALAAGPYAFIPADQGPGEVPMKAYCVAQEQTLLHLETYADFIFDVTKKSMKSYQSFFGQPYPFQKYDMIWVRDYSSYAMENAGLVTFSEQLTLLTFSTEDDYYELADTLAHELAHHWFGNLVTMNWWDDLWLNESFADFISQYTLGKINDTLLHPLKYSAMYFRNRKSWGYQQDERKSATHPIRTKVPDTDIASSIFDGITYAKGAAVLKQLMFLVGENNFSKGLQSYFERFKWSNATIDDFLTDFKPYFPTSTVTLDVWKHLWLQTPSLNVIEAIWDPADASTVATLWLYQSPFLDRWSYLRPHQIQVAFFDDLANITEIKSVLLSPSVRENSVSYNGTNGVQAIFVNYGDQSFLQNYIDNQSLQFFMKNISKITDELTRSLIWFNISQLNKQTLLRLDDYVTFVVNNLFDEPLTFVLNQLLSQLLTFLKNYTSNEEMLAQTGIVFDTLYGKLQDTNIVKSDRVTIFISQFIDYAQTDAQILKLKDLLLNADPTIIDRQQYLNDKHPWQIVKKVFSVSDSTLSVAEKWAVFAAANQFDDSTRADDAKVVCDAILLNTQSQLEALYLKFSENEIDLQTRQLLAEGWRSKYHADLVNTFKSQYFTDIEANQKLPYAFFQLFYTSLRSTDTDYSNQIFHYDRVISNMSVNPNMAAHINNLYKIVDDLTLNVTNIAFNSDSNLTLTQLRAADRYSYIRGGSISYISHLGFISLDQIQMYTGLTEISFELTALPKILPIDFVSELIVDLVVNGRDVTPTMSGQFLLIPRIYLKLGVNNIGIHYINKFNNDGLGCMLFNDLTVTPSQTYIYTQFEPYSAHRMIPCFDQPDLKASVSFNIILTTGWLAVGNQTDSYNGVYSEADYIAHAPFQDQKLLVSKYLTGKQGNFYVLNPTKSISPYLYCIAVGDYVYQQLPAPDRYNDIPMRIYSLASYSDALARNAPFIFQITKLSVQFFQGKFNVKYPFTKYDTVFCHEFSAGAMENPGIITFNDTYLYQEVVSNDKMLQLGVVIAHECAHNWFGDLVTMKWWDDLWLNESFADFMSYFCIDGIKAQVTTIPAYTTGWIGGIARAVGGYREDQLSTTHPVRSAVPNTSVATVYFDNITYRKGLSVLKQLMFLMGEQNFFKGVTAYFTTFAWKNGTIDDFLTSLDPYYVNPDLDHEYSLEIWKEMWLLTASLNLLQVSWDAGDKSPTATLTITQTNFDPKYQMLRYHGVNIAFFKSDGSYTTRKYLLKNAVTNKVQYDGSGGVVAILINEGLQDYVKYVIDDISLAFFQQNINSITAADPADAAQTRMIIWFYMNEMVRDGRKKLLPYVDVIKTLIPKETEDGIYDFQLKFLNESTGSYIPMAIRTDVREQTFNYVLGQLTSFNSQPIKQKGQKCLNMHNSRMPKSHIPIQIYKQNKLKCQTISDTANRIKILKDLLPVFCSTDAQIDILNQWRQGTYVDLVNYPITLTQLWAVVKIIFTSNSPDLPSNVKQDIYNAEKQNHPGILADLAGNTISALDADSNAFDNIYQIFEGEFYSLTEKASYSQGWNNAYHLDWLKNTYKARFFQDIPDLSLFLPNKHFEFFYTNLKPIDDDLQGIIASFSAINLPGSDMIGHMNNIRKITDIYRLRSMLYIANSLLEN